MYNAVTKNKRNTWLLLIVFVGLTTGLGYVLALILDAGVPLIVGVGVFAGVMAATSWFAGDRVALVTAGARRVEETADPELYRLVENLAIAAGLPRPALYLIDDPSLNAFATGRSPERASVAVTTGLRQALTRTELEGVLAHELSHIKNFDTRYLMVTALLIGFVALASDFFLRAQLFGFGQSRRENGQLGFVLLIVGVVLAILVPVAAKLLQFAVSRQREFLADASGALLTRYPEGLASALEKIGRTTPAPTAASQATAPLYFANPFGEGRRKQTGRWARLFSTHPPIAERIAALREQR